MTPMTRRGFFDRVSTGLQGVALATLLGKDLYADEAPRRIYDLRPRPPHRPAKAKAVIQLFQNGGPSQVDLFDPKPTLDRLHGQSVYSQLAADVSSPESAGGLLRSPFKFARRGQSGLWLSDAMPQLVRHIDDLAVIRSMYNSHPNHEPALFKIHTGQLLPGLPALGSWVVYGLGTENQNLPAYVVLDDPLGLPVNGVQSWQAGYLPPVYQGTRFRSTGAPLVNLRPEVEQSAEVHRLQQDLLSRLDRMHQQSRPGQLQLDARISSYELAARMQMEATDALDLRQETRATLERYGVGTPAAASWPAASSNAASATCSSSSTPRSGTTTIVSNRASSPRAIAPISPSPHCSTT
jgi:hypothetical protein